VITVSRDERDASLSTVYGNPRAIDHLRGALSGARSFVCSRLRAGPRDVVRERRSALVWRSDPGADVLEARRITVGATADEQPTYECEDRGGGEPQQPAAPCPSDAVDALLSGSTAP
jgi:hypothetical protein